ncbi:hypothetical protein AOLI_G00087440 [Acnodon oligacanthus]
MLEFQTPNSCCTEEPARRGLRMRPSEEPNSKQGLHGRGWFNHRGQCAEQITPSLVALPLFAYMLAFEAVLAVEENAAHQRWNCCTCVQRGRSAGEMQERTAGCLLPPTITLRTRGQRENNRCVVCSLSRRHCLATTYEKVLPVPFVLVSAGRTF